MNREESTRAVLGLGSNLGGRESLLRAARDLLACAEGVTLEASSRVYRTPPWGPVAQPDYLNAALLVRLAPGRSAGELLALCLRVEAQLGRVRDARWGPRTIDLDVLWVEDTAVLREGLEVPHRRLRERVFALAPLCDVAPDARDPGDRVSYSEVLASLSRESADAMLEVGPFTPAFESVELDHTADEGFVVRARDRADALAAAAEALGALIVRPETVRAVEVRPIELAFEEGGGDDDRFFAWLSEVLYQLDAGRFALRRAVLLEDGPMLRAQLWGEPIDAPEARARHDVRGALKAVTYHAMEVGPDPSSGLYRAQVVVDV